MIRSMTGFASVETQSELGRITIEMRSVNHRYLDVNLRLPEEFRVLEPAFRTAIGDALGRGKIDATLRFQPAPEAIGQRVELNEDLARGLLQVHESLAQLANQESPPNLGTLLRWPGVVIEAEVDLAPLHEAALDLLNQAIEQLQAGRSREGQAMAQAISDRLDGIAQWTSQVREWIPDIRAGLEARLAERVADLDQPADPGRLEQEVAFFAGKMDVDEELDRLDAHVTETRRALDREEPVGRRLDFLMQEFNREVNTLSSKSVDARTSKAAVELKVLVEQVREQVQNIE
ncbi:MAG: YicC/YloC family endoribonuclease [Xanthomonadales bacterium]|nr:YicC/YloC family endoribonuclease [Xanthomonadales bacterium]